jgi:methylglutaconyl-CoA hydratase
MTSKKIINNIKNHIGFITLNHPEKHNAIDVEIRDALISTFHDYEKNADIRVIILNANGKHFCAGADLDHMKQMTNASPDENLNDAKKFAELFYTIYACEKPTIVCAHGKSIGGGIGLIAACDIAIASSDAAFCFSEVKIGLMPAVIAPIVTQRIGHQQAKYHMMTAAQFDAKTALKMALIDKISDPTYALSLAESLLTNNQTAMQRTKKWLQTLRPVTKAHMYLAAEELANIRS